MVHIEKVPQYSFDSFLNARDSLDDLENPFLLKVLERTAEEDWAEIYNRLKPFTKMVSTTWRKTANEIARPENHPSLRHYDAYNRRIDRIVRPLDAVRLSDEVFGEGLFSDRLLSYEGIMKRYFLQGNGEAGITCPIACTDGLIALIEAYLDEVPEEVRAIYVHTKEGINGDFAIGAQFMSEIHGGSNIPANELQAVPEGSHYRLFGNKFFCSAVHADYSVVTAKIDGTKDIAVFVVPSYLPDNKEKEFRNGYHINRLKWKIGTTELPSGEIDYNGALAYRIGPQNRGVALAVSIVLTRSRLDIGFGSAAFVMRAAREAKLYARFRHVFDRTIDGFPMAAAQLDELEDAAKRMAATAFHIYQMFQELDENDGLQQFVLRELILLQKVYAAKEAVNQLRLAISIFGGHGAIEDFSSIPRLFRDSLVNELWEGPKNVLLTQIYRDLLRMSKVFPLETIVKTMFPHLSEAEIQRYSSRIDDFIKEGIVDRPTPSNKQAARNWELLMEELFLSFQYAVMTPFKDLPILNEDVFTKL